MTISPLLVKTTMAKAYTAETSWDGTDGRINATSLWQPPSPHQRPCVASNDVVNTLDDASKTMPHTSSLPTIVSVSFYKGGGFMNSMKLVIPWHFNSWKKTPIDAVTPQRFRVCFHLWCELTTTMNVTEWQVSWNSYVLSGVVFMLGFPLSMIKIDELSQGCRTGAWA